MSSAEGALAPLYIVTSFIWDDDSKVETLQQPEIYHDLETANESAKSMMNRYAEKLKLPKGSKNWDFSHHSESDGSYFGFLTGGTNGNVHVAARVKVFQTAMPGGSIAENDNEVVKKAETDDGMIKNEDVSDTKMETTEAKDEEDDEEVAKLEDAEEEEEDEVVEEEEEEEKKPAKRPARPKMKKTAVVPATHRKKIPSGKPNCLEGLKLLFTGTFETMDRKTSVATAITYGAQVITKLEDTDYIVLGTRAGPKKLQEINEKELETITEEEFFQILENGVPEEKRERMAARKAADEEEEPEEEEEKPVTKRKGAAASASARKRTKK